MTTTALAKAVAASDTPAVARVGAMGVPPAHLGIDARFAGQPQFAASRAALEAGVLRAAAQEPSLARFTRAFSTVVKAQGVRGLWRGFPPTATHILACLLLGAPFMLPLVLGGGFTDLGSSDSGKMLAQIHTGSAVACALVAHPLVTLATRVAADRSQLTPRALPPLPKQLADAFARAKTDPKGRKLLHTSSPSLAVLRDVALLDTWRGSVRGLGGTVAYLAAYAGLYTTLAGPASAAAERFVIRKHGLEGRSQADLAADLAALAPKAGQPMGAMERDLLGAQLAASTACATAAGLAAYPIDSLRLAVTVAQARGFAGLAQSGSTYLGAARLLWRAGGARAFFRGAWQVPLVHAPLFTCTGAALAIMGRMVWPQDAPPLDVRHFCHFQPRFSPL